MQFSKSTLLPILGLVVLGFFILLAYLNNHIFLDKIILCSLILCLVLFAKTRGEGNNNSRNIDSSKYTDLN
jgi:hypothetical protein